MNQILMFRNTENSQKIIKKNAKHLCIYLILFALILVGEGGWKLYSNLKKEVYVIKPEITGNIELDKTIFNVKSEVGIKKIAYAWNNGEETIIDKSGEKEFSFEVNNPIGVNELALKSYAVDGSTVTYDTIKIVYDEPDDEFGGPDAEIPQEVDKKTAIENEALVEAFMKSDKTLEEAIAFLIADGVKEEPEEAPKKPAARRGRKRKTTGN